MLELIKDKLWLICLLCSHLQYVPFRGGSIFWEKGRNCQNKLCPWVWEINSSFTQLAFAKHTLMKGHWLASVSCIFGVWTCSVLSSSKQLAMQGQSEQTAEYNLNITLIYTRLQSNSIDIILLQEFTIQNSTEREGRELEANIIRKNTHFSSRTCSVTFIYLKDLCPVSIQWNHLQDSVQSIRTIHIAPNEIWLLYL